jgi:hypothetical protein
MIPNPIGKTYHPALTPSPSLLVRFHGRETRPERTAPKLGRGEPEPEVRKGFRSQKKAVSSGFGMRSYLR